jgi:hypothetical protein
MTTRKERTVEDISVTSAKVVPPCPPCWDGDCAHCEGGECPCTASENPRKRRPDNYAALLALAEAATPGEWEQATERCGCVFSGGRESLLFAHGEASYGQSSADAAYIAAASPDVIARLIADLREARGAIPAFSFDGIEMNHRLEAAEAEVARLSRVFDIAQERMLDAESKSDDARLQVAEWQARVAVLEEEARTHPLAAALALQAESVENASRLLAERHAALDRVRALEDRTFDEAPVHLSSESSYAWADGYSAALADTIRALDGEGS